MNDFRLNNTADCPTPIELAEPATATPSKQSADNQLEIESPEPSDSDSTTFLAKQRNIPCKYGLMSKSTVLANVSRDQQFLSECSVNEPSDTEAPT